MARPVRFNIHPIEADIKNNISLVDMPEGYSGDGFFTAKTERCSWACKKKFYVADAFCNIMLRY